MLQLKSLQAAAASALDAKLMGPSIGYTLAQLMELAGLSVAQTVSQLTPKDHPIVVLCGPGNNGGDGLVAARHLYLFGHKNVHVYWPIKGKNTLYGELELQLNSFNINQLSLNQLTDLFKTQNLIIIDALFGFSFHPPLRPPFDSLISEMIISQSNGSKIISVDVPSGWDVNTGPNNGIDYCPDTLVSLTAPKPCSRFMYLAGKRHFLGGRFIPDGIAKEFNITDILNLYKSTDQIVDITKYEIL